MDIQTETLSFSTKGAGRGLGTYGMKLLTERYLNGSVSFVSSQATERQLLSAIFSRANGYHCLGAYQNGSDALEHIPVAEPDLVVSSLLIAVTVTVAGLGTAAGAV